MKILCPYCHRKTVDCSLYLYPLLHPESITTMARSALDRCSTCNLMVRLSWQHMPEVLEVGSPSNCYTLAQLKEQSEAPEPPAQERYIQRLYLPPEIESFGENTLFAQNLEGATAEGEAKIYRHRRVRELDSGTEFAAKIFDNETEEAVLTTTYTVDWAMRLHPSSKVEHKMENKNDR